MSVSQSNIRFNRWVCFSGVCLCVSVCLSVSVGPLRQVFFLGVVIVGVLGWRVRVLAHGGGGITTDPVEFPCLS